MSIFLELMYCDLKFSNRSILPLTTSGKLDCAFNESDNIEIKYRVDFSIRMAPWVCFKVTIIRLMNCLVLCTCFSNAATGP